MSSVLFTAVVLTFIKVVLMFGLHGVEADFSDNCVNSTNSLTCIRTYEQLYNSLTKSDNSFNIESALYPAKKPSSVRVFVNVYGPNKTENPIAQYTWSISCLYVAVPAPFLELWSLGSILVTPRTQTLNITIPLLCCNVSKQEDERRKKINEMIEGVLAALQDLAISPGIRDPRLNTAECVIEGHEPDKKATGRGHHIDVILWSSFCIAFYFGVFLGHGFNYCELNAQWSEGNHKTVSRNLDTNCQEGNQIRKKNIARALCYLGYLLTVVCSGWHIATFIFLYERNFCEIATATIAACFSFLWFTKVVFFFYPPGSKLYLMPPEPRRGLSSTTDATRGTLVDAGLFFRVLVKQHFVFSDHRCRKDFPFIIRAVLGLSPPGPLNFCFCSCWMLIGIMLNPTWGLTLTMIIGFSLAALTYAVYQYYSISNDLPAQYSKLNIVIYCVFGLFVVFLLDIVIVFAGQSYNGRETANETLKTALLSALGAFVSWLSWKAEPLNFSQGSEERQTQSPPSDTSANDEHTPRHLPPAGDSLTVNGQTFEEIECFSSDISTDTGNIRRNATLGRESLSDIATAADVHQPPSSDTSTNTQDIRRETLRRGDSSSVTVDVHEHPSDTVANTGQTRNHQRPLETYVDSSTEDTQTIENVRLISVYESTV